MGRTGHRRPCTVCVAHLCRRSVGGESHPLDVHRGRAADWQATPICVLTLRNVRREKRITPSLEQYVERAVIWWKHNPWTIIIACASGKPWGMCTALPLTETAYAAITNGEIASFELGPADFSTPTGRLLIEAAAERPEELGGDLQRARTALQVAMSAQAAALTRADILSRDHEVCLLSFAASPKTARRLRSFGFVETGRRMKHTNVEFMERRLDYGKFGNPENAFWHGLLLKLAQECSDMPDPIEL